MIEKRALGNITRTLTNPNLTYIQGLCLLSVLTKGGVLSSGRKKAGGAVGDSAVLEVAMRRAIIQRLTNLSLSATTTPAAPAAPPRF